jgi:hypothetical protein
MRRRGATGAAHPVCLSVCHESMRRRGATGAAHPCQCQYPQSLGFASPILHVRVADRPCSRHFCRHVPQDVTHVVVDEIHERDRFADFLLIMLRDILPAHPTLRVVLMSATLHTQLFSSYFGGCPIVSVPGFMHPVQVGQAEAPSGCWRWAFCFLPRFAWGRRSKVVRADSSLRLAQLLWAASVRIQRVPGPGCGQGHTLPL